MVVIHLMLSQSIIQGGSELGELGWLYDQLGHPASHVRMKKTHIETQRSDIDSIPYVYIQMLYIHMQYKDIGVELDICISYRNIDIH